MYIFVYTLTAKEIRRSVILSDYHSVNRMLCLSLNSIQQEVWVDKKLEVVLQERVTRKRVKGSYVQVRCKNKKQGLRGIVAWVRDCS